jgi:hypothetical protein
LCCYETLYVNEKFIQHWCAWWVQDIKIPTTFILMFIEFRKERDTVCTDGLLYKMYNINNMTIGTA